jgi:FAD/FMN-containing dehydrogenase
MRVLSWGRYPHLPQQPHAVTWPDDVPQVLERASQEAGHALAMGMGRSYGDSCLAASNHVLAMRGMDRILHVNWDTGLVVAQAGLTLDALIAVALPHGWFVPVTPGTRYVTLGGAVANDVHGKNHHVKGTFGRHVCSLSLYRSDEGVVQCSPDTRTDLFAATVGGLGLTGVILTVVLQLRRVASSQIQQRTLRFGGLDEFFDIAAEYDSRHEYGVAWIDCLAIGASAGRGLYLAGDHAEEGPLQVASDSRLAIPVELPVSLVNKLTLRPFNTLYYHRQRQPVMDSRVDYAPYFYPLDGIRHWNRMYGRAGFQQYQCVVPPPVAREAMRDILREIARSGTGSFLAVLKQCGTISSPGLLSFPMSGTSLALDFPQKDAVNDQLFNRLDALVHEAGGRLYPAKDAHMSAAHFRQAYPAWQQVEALRDPKLLSHFWRRVAL